MKRRDRAAMRERRVPGGVRGWGCPLETVC